MRELSTQLGREPTNAEIAAALPDETPALTPQRVEEIRKGLPEGTTIRTVYDQSTFIAAAIGEVKSAALIGGLSGLFGALLGARIAANASKADREEARRARFADVVELVAVVHRQHDRLAQVGERGSH